MATCDHCKREMLSADGCTLNPIPDYKNGIGPGDGIVTAIPIKYGDEKRYDECSPFVRERIEASKKDPNHRCHDCGAKIGQYHHPGCDMEECPFCHHQLISCGCLEPPGKA